MSIRQIMQSRLIVVAAADHRKAEALRATLEGPISPDIPASILQRHPDCRFFVDPPAASLLR